MSLFLAISQGTGLALATGVRPFLPPLVAGALARADAGIDFTGSDYSFLESIPFLAAMVAIALGATAAQRMSRERAFVVLTGGAAVALGALEFAGSLAGEGHRAAPGLLAGAVAALLAYLATTLFLGRAQVRLAARERTRPGREPGSAPRSLLTVYADAAAVCLAVVSIFIEPISYVALGLLIWVLIQVRRRESRKYEGLRVLR